jgi:hypothetical protein
VFVSAVVFTGLFVSRIGTASDPKSGSALKRAIGKIENILALFVSVFIFYMGIEILFGALNNEGTELRKVYVIAALCLFAAWGLSGVYLIKWDEAGCVQRFGAVAKAEVGSGLHYRLPFPIDRVQKVNTAEIRLADVGINLPNHMHSGDVPQPIQLLTGDENIIAAEAIVHYTVRTQPLILPGALSPGVHKTNSGKKTLKLINSTVSSGEVKTVTERPLWTTDGFFVYSSKSLYNKLGCIPLLF